MSSAGPRAQPFWQDASADLKPAAPMGIPRLKRSMMDSPFAGSISKRPFRNKGFDPVPEDAPVVHKEEPGTSAFSLGSSSLGPIREEGITTANLLSRLPSIPGVVTTASYMQVRVPLLWEWLAESKRTVGSGAGAGVLICDGFDCWRCACSGQ